jgi:hypothetical protein
MDKCSEYIHKYFAARRSEQRVYGLLPAVDSLAAIAAEEACGFSFKHPNPENHVLKVEPMGEAEALAVATIRELFAAHVNVPAIVGDALSLGEASEMACTRAAAMRLLGSEPSALLRQPTTLMWVMSTAFAAYFIHLLLAFGKLLRLQRG